MNVSVLRSDGAHPPRMDCLVERVGTWPGARSGHSGACGDHFPSIRYRFPRWVYVGVRMLKIMIRHITKSTVGITTPCSSVSHVLPPACAFDLVPPCVMFSPIRLSQAGRAPSRRVRFFMRTSSAALTG